MPWPLLLLLLSPSPLFGLGSASASYVTTSAVNYSHNRAANGDVVQCATTTPVQRNSDYVVAVSCSSGAESVVAIGFARWA